MSTLDKVSNFREHRSNLWERIKDLGSQVIDAVVNLPSTAIDEIENFASSEKSPSEPQLRDYISELSQNKGKSKAGAGEEPEGLGTRDPNAPSGSPSLQPSLQDAELNTGTPRQDRRVEESFALTDTDPVGLADPVRDDVMLTSGQRRVAHMTHKGPVYYDELPDDYPGKNNEEMGNNEGFEATWESMHDEIGKLPKQDQDVLSFVHDFIENDQIKQAQSVVGRLEGPAAEAAKKLLKAAGL